MAENTHPYKKIKMEYIETALEQVLIVLLG